jgi:sortase A
MTEPEAIPAGPAADPPDPAPAPPPQPGAPDRARLLRWAEALLLIVAITCLGIYAWATLDARLYQAAEERRLERELDAALPGDEGVPDPVNRRVSALLPPLPSLPVAPGDPIGRMEIPRLGVSVIVAEGIDNRTLRRAVGHIPGTALPGEEGHTGGHTGGHTEGHIAGNTAGNIGIAGHRDGFFRPLKDIQSGDEVVLTTTRGTHRYLVEKTLIVPPERTDVLAPTDEPTLTLVTCYPFYYVGSAPQRFIVQAREVAADAPAS